MDLLAITTKQTPLTKEEIKFVKSQKIDWEDTSKDKTLSEAFIEAFANKVDWSLIFVNQTLSEQFIEKWADKFDREVWWAISINQVLSEAFIEKHADKVDWDMIAAHQKLSEPFIAKMRFHFNWHYIRCNRIFDKKIRKKYAVYEVEKSYDLGLADLALGGAK